MSRKIVVITGVSKGIGQALAREFKWNGFFVVGISRSEPQIGIDEWIEADLTKRESVARAATIIKQKYQEIDLLINNAGRGLYETWADSEITDINEMFNLNFFSMVDLTQRLLPMIIDSQGTIINISSVAARLPIACMGAYCASKAAVSSFSDSLRIEMKPHNVNVMKVEPGRIGTGFSKGCTGTRAVPSTPRQAKGPEKMVEKIFKAFIQRKESLVFPKWYKFIYLAKHIFKKKYTKKNLEKWDLQ